MPWLLLVLLGLHVDRPRARRVDLLEDLPDLAELQGPIRANVDGPRTVLELLLDEAGELVDVDAVGLDVGAIATNAHDDLLTRVLALGMMLRRRQFQVDAAMEHRRDDHEDD